MIAVNRAEINRYLGYHGQMPDAIVTEKIERCLAALQQVAQPRCVSQSFVLTVQSECLSFAGITVQSRALSRNVAGCNHVILFAATLGVAVDRLMTRAAVNRVSDAVVYQAAAAALIEGYCNEENEKLRQRAAAEGQYLRPRFSPGYGDFPLSCSAEILRLLEAPKKIGLTTTDGGLLTPLKSVTAVIGQSAQPLHCVTEGCEACSKTDCEFRR